MFHLLLILAISIILGILLIIETNNNYKLKSKVDYLEKRIIVLSIQNRELSKLPIDNIKFKRLKESLIRVKNQTLNGRYPSGETFCRDVCKIIKTYCE